VHPGFELGHDFRQPPLSRAIESVVLHVTCFLSGGQLGSGSWIS
jgi:hypothetical protein